MALYDTTGGELWYSNTGWGSNEPLGDWYGVEVDEEGSVIGLRLSSNNLKGMKAPRSSKVISFICICTLLSFPSSSELFFRSHTSRTGRSHRPEDSRIQK
ncbi:unnamed protein product [Chrysoparadoxa australica]